MKGLLRLATALLALHACAVTRAADSPAPVVIGSYVNQITNFSLRDNSVEVDFYVWFRWQDADLDPFATFELMNGRIEDRQLAERRRIGDWEYAQGRVLARLNDQWNIRRFPLDSHEIRIEIEDSVLGTEGIIYEPDVENAAVREGIVIPGYRVASTGATQFVNTYATNYGNTELPSGNITHFSRYVQSISIERRGIGYFIKLFSTIFIAVLVGFLAFAMDPDQIDARLGLGVGSLFAAVASYFVISSQLPETDLVTLADKMNIAAIGMIFLTLVQSAFVLKFHHEHAALCRRIDHWSLVVFPIVYTGICMLLARQG